MREARGQAPPTSEIPNLKLCVLGAKKVPGGFTRGGNPTTLLKAGFRFVSLSADNWDVMSAMDVYLHGQTGPAGPFQLSLLPHRGGGISIHVGCVDFSI